MFVSESELRCCSANYLNALIFHFDRFLGIFDSNISRALITSILFSYSTTAGSHLCEDYSIHSRMALVMI